VAALANLRAALQAWPAAQVEMEVIDVLEAPDRGVRDGILVTPMLVKIGPLPERRLLGNLRDRTALLEALGADRVSRG
jgi:circadian clock protein KaiB